MSSTYDERRLAAVRIVETLRSGVPTRFASQQLLDLRPKLLDVMRSDLAQLAADQAPKGRLVWGQYGQGKSHFLTLLEHHALAEGFAVSHVTLSREVSCHNLFNFFRRVAPVLRTPDSQVPGLQVQLMRKQSNDLPGSPIQRHERYEHPLPAVILECLLQAEEEAAHDLYHDLVGERIQIKELRQIARSLGLEQLTRGLPPFKQSQIKAYYGALADTIRFCGYKGWVLLIDEVELVARLGKISRLAAYRNLDWLLNWGGQLPFPIYTVCAAATSLQEKWHAGTELRPGDRTAIPQLAQARLGEPEATAMRNFFERALSDHCPDLPPLEPRELKGLLEQLVNLHGIAYDWTPPAAELAVELAMAVARHKPVRTYIRALLQALDCVKLTGTLPDLEAAALREHSMKEEAQYFQDEVDSAGEGSST